MTYRSSELLDKAKAATARRADGSYDEEELLASIEVLITIDVDAERRRQAKAIIDGASKPGGTEETGQLQLPGMDPYDYEPYRLIRDSEGHVIEQDMALTRYKFAESSRAAKHSREAAEWAHRKRVESELYAAWVIENQDRGRRDRLTFGDFVRESEMFKELVEK